MGIGLEVWEKELGTESSKMRPAKPDRNDEPVHTKQLP